MSNETQIMSNETQHVRYRKLLSFIDEHFKEDINIPEIEDVCHYSYRNINRIFEALNHETIGKYIKRTRLERGAQYLKYSQEGISEIAYEVGFGDVAAFSKAFKNKFNCSPSAFREGNKLFQQINESVVENTKSNASFSMSFEIETLPDFQILGLEYKGSYEDISGINKIWKQLVKYASNQKLLDDNTIHLAEILDDDEISEQINCRYTAAIMIDDLSHFEPNGFFVRKRIESRKYAKILHKGSHESSSDTYNRIYSHWMKDVQLELADAPVLEFYLNDERYTSSKNLMTEIYIPVE